MNVACLWKDQGRYGQKLEDTKALRSLPWSHHLDITCWGEKATARGVAWWWWRSLISLGLYKEQSKGLVMLSTQPMGLPSVPSGIRHLHCSPHCFYLRLSSPKHQTVTNGFPTSGKHLGWLQQIPLNTKLLLHLGSWSLWLLSPVSWVQGVWDKERSNAPKGWERTTCSPATHPLTRGKSFSLSANPFLICLWLDHTVIEHRFENIFLKISTVFAELFSVFPTSL